MDINLLARFFAWCTIINAGLLIFSFLLFLVAGDFIYKLHSRWFSMPRETFNVTYYAFIGIYKLMVFVFNLVPWIALKIIG